ncbi:unnamed protein product [Rotaria sp. Silwood2]|nr:unnamed protein product [Rotaria sp. Silwood2]
MLEVEHLQSFENFRRHVYYVNHQRIKCSFQDYPNIDITDIRLVSINESVQNDFMERMNNNTSYFSKLVYHGTKLKNIESILRYGFLIPNRAHPTNNEPSIIVSQNGRSFRTGIYSLSYVHVMNNLLVCAALPKRNKFGRIKHSHGNILVLSHVSQILPLFLIDFKYLNSSHMNYPCFNEEKQVQINKNNEIKKPIIISRKYLRKLLNYMNDEVRKNNRYQRSSYFSPWSTIQFEIYIETSKYC